MPDTIATFRQVYNLNSFGIMFSLVDASLRKGGKESSCAAMRKCVDSHRVFLLFVCSVLHCALVLVVQASFGLSNADEQVGDEGRDHLWETKMGAWGNDLTRSPPRSPANLRKNL